jgi:hypothetical protein
LFGRKKHLKSVCALALMAGTVLVRMTKNGGPCLETSRISQLPEKDFHHE